MSSRSDSSVEHPRARDAHRSATALTLLVFLWSAVALAVDPWEPFWVPNLAQVVGCTALLVYFLSTWNRPRRRTAEAISAALVGYALLLLPWIAIEWCRLGRPMDALFVPQVAAVSMALVFPGRWALGVTAMVLFTAESLFVSAYARHLGLEARIPITEPFATFAFTMLGLGLFIVRRRRRDLARQHVRVQAEIQALDRVRPLFTRASEELDAQVEILAAEVLATPAPGPGVHASAIGRAVDRLAGLRGTLDHLVTGEPPDASAAEVERQRRAHDAQLGAILLAALGAALAVPALLTIHAHARLSGVPLAMSAALFTIYGALLTYLIVTRRRPSSRRALWAVLVLYATTLPIISYNQYWLVQAGRPFAPFVGHKLLMGVLGLTVATRFKLGIALIAVTAASALALWHLLDLGAYRDLIALGEPWTTLTFLLIGVASLRMLEQRQTASLHLLRAEAEASAMQRRAAMLLALRDRLNSPLQTLALGASSATSHLPAGSGEKVRAAIDRLVALSRELAELDVLVPSPSLALDADRELQRQT